MLKVLLVLIVFGAPGEKPNVLQLPEANIQDCLDHAATFLKDAEIQKERGASAGCVIRNTSTEG